MEPNKLENYIQEKLNSREIQPSDPAWDRLDAMLSVAEDKKPKRKLPWFAIAASFIGFIFVGLFLLNQNNKNVLLPKNENTIVKSSKSEKKPLDKTEKIYLETKTETTIASVQKKVFSAATTNKDITKSENTTPKTQNIESAPIQQQTTIVAVVVEKKVEKSKLEINPEALLASVEKQITNKPKLKINPRDLLVQVDGEIEMTFREKVIQSINQNYSQTKQALAVRNQE